MGTLTAHDRRRLRVTWIVAGVGVVVGVLGAAGVAAIGGTGRAGFAVLVVCTALGAVVSALVTGLLALVDEWRDAPVAGRRGLIALGLFVGAALLMVIVSGL
jgi:L-cystine uptake protein TcyP (sodium:dicarboxylate symporter family)